MKILTQIREHGATLCQNAAHIRLLQPLDMVAIIAVEEARQGPVLLDLIKELLDRGQHRPFGIGRKRPCFAGSRTEIESHLQVGVEVFRQLDLSGIDNGIINFALCQPCQQFADS